MIETIDNIIQLAITGGCTGASFICAMRFKDQKWILLGLFSGIYFLGDLYWLLFLVFYQNTPAISYISDLSWYASYLFLLLLLIRMNGEKFRPDQILRRRRVLWLVPVFTIGMCIFFMHWGEHLSNIVAAVLMTGLLLCALDGLIMYRRRTDTEGKRRYFYILTIVFCLLEYALWVSSCFWMGDTARNPYFWFDLLLSITFLFFPLVLRKAVAR